MGFRKKKEEPTTYAGVKVSDTWNLEGSLVGGHTHNKNQQLRTRKGPKGATETEYRCVCGEKWTEYA